VRSPVVCCGAAALKRILETGGTHAGDILGGNTVTTTTRPTTDHAGSLRASLEQGYTLPAEWYTDPAFFAAERQRIFRHCWQYVGLTEQVTRTGDFFTTWLGEVPVVVVRDAPDTLRAFVNVCRHRGSTLVLDACGHRNTLQCHYHAWTYNLDGSLRAAPGSKDEPGFDRAAFPLLPVQVANFGPFIFVNPDADAPPLATILGDLPRQVAATGLDFPGLHRRVRREYDIAANWKVVLDNYLECYHCPIAHKGFSDLIDLEHYDVAEYEYVSTQGGPLTPAARAGTARSQLYDTSEGVRDGFYAFVWPNFTLNIYPGPGYVSLNLFVPVDEHHTKAIYEYCFVDAVSAEQEQQFVRFIDQVQQEDIVLCESVQRGLRSGFFERGRLMLHREKGLRHFQQLVHRFLTAPSPPAATPQDPPVAP
jgi:choline monooxygenase